jgi:GntR family transcriptional regulator
VFLTIDPADRTPVYEQIANGIRGLIASGQLREGMQLSPVRQVAADLNVNLNTVATAYRALQDEGLVTIKAGSGVTVAARTTPSRTAEELRRPLRTALTQMVLAGLRRSDIMEAVADELRALTKGARS